MPVDRVAPRWAANARLVAGLVLVSVLLTATVVPTQADSLPDPPGERIHVDATGTTGPFPRPLLGTAMDPLRVDTILELRDAGVPHIRVPAYFDRAALETGAWRFGEIDRRLGSITASGAEPVVVLGFTPAWLSSCETIGPLEARFCPPEDLDTWRRVVAEGAAYMAREHGVRTFEVWNEPDHPYFWRGTLADYLALYEASVAGVRDAEAASGHALDVGGPALLGPNPAWMAPFLSFAEARGLPVDVVSFHWYADYPFVAGSELFPGTVVEDDPLVRPAEYAEHAAHVRTLADAAGFEDAELWITEWNLNAGHSPREETRYGAAFLAASVHAMASAPIDRASFFKTQGAHGALFETDGSPNPTWHALEALLGMGSIRLPVEEAAVEQTGVLAARDDDGTVRVTVHHFDPQAAQAGLPVERTVALDIDGVEGTPYEVRSADGTLVEQGRLASPLDLEVPNLSVWTVQIQG